MGSFLDGLGTIVGGQGNAGAASSNAWNYGQYSPFTVNNPMGQTSFSGTTANSSLSPLQSQLQGAFGQSILSGLGAQGQYNPNTSFLPQQYQQIYGNMQGNANSMFNNLQQAQAPWVAQGNASNLDNQFSKGTLASTAGGYQTAGHDMSNNALMQQNQATAQQFALSQANSQFGAAQGTAGLGEQQAQFGSQLGLQQAQAGISGLNNQNSQFLQQLQAAGNLGAQRSGANVAAATPGIGTGETQDQATAGLLSGLLFGGGSQGGLLSSLLGNNGSSGGGLAGLLGKGGSLLGNLFSGSGSSSGPDYSSSGNLSNLANSGYGGYSPPGMQSIGVDPVDSLGTLDSDGNWYDGGFNGAGGQAAAPGLDNIGVDQINETSQAQNALSGVGGSSLGLGDAGAINGAIQGILSGKPVGYLGAAASLGKLGGKLTGATNLSQASGALGSALGLYGGIQQGGASGYTNAALSAAQLGAQTGAFGGASATVGAVAGPLALALGPALFGMSQPAYTLGGAYYDRLDKSFTDTISKGRSDPLFMSNYSQLMNSGELSGAQTAQLNAMAGFNTNYAPTTGGFAGGSKANSTQKK